MMTSALERFKMKTLSKIGEIERELIEKYGEEVKEVIQRLVVKVAYMNKYTLNDYLFTLSILSTSYPELTELAPSEEEIEEIINEPW